MRYKGWIFLVFLLSLSFLGQAQGQLLQVIRADSLNGMQQELIVRKTLIGRVLLQQGTTTLYCDQAVLNSTTNNVEAYGLLQAIRHFIMGICVRLSLAVG
jgi:lipopolysaccharide export system protein LptA